MSTRPGTRTLTSGLVAGALACGLLTVTSSPGRAGARASGWQACLSGSPQRQAAFARAARFSGVPRSVLLGVSFLESRWDDHGGSPSTSGGYGPMHLTHVVSSPLSEDPQGKGDGTDRVSTATGPETGQRPTAATRTLDRAARLTGYAPSVLQTNSVANICGGAALLAAGFRASGSWSAAVAGYSNAGDEPTALRFARQVYKIIRTGAVRTTLDGQRVRLAGHPRARVSIRQVRALSLARPSPDGRDGVDCPARLGCVPVPAPYEQYGPDPGDYGNHDPADRPRGLRIDHIVIHDTEGVWERALQLVQDPTYLGWHYTVRSADGRIAAHVSPRDIGWHAGNWYLNMHSIGVEHEGVAAQGATWYTEVQYRSSAALVRYLAHMYGVPLDRAHIIGHDQVPGITPDLIAGMHWDPGPYWDWQHYLALLGHPIRPEGQVRGRIATVRPGFTRNRQLVAGCDSDGTCPLQGTNFVYLHQTPSVSSPLVGDLGLHPDGSPSTTGVSDTGARVSAGQKIVVAERRGRWLGVWWQGGKAWLRDGPAHRAVVPGRGRLVVARGGAPVPVYGRAYPEPAAYPTQIPVQLVRPLPYTILSGQAYVVADVRPATDYYYAKTFRCSSAAMDCTDVVGQDRYYQIWFGHRIAYVRAADVRLR